MTENWQKAIEKDLHCLTNYGIIVYSNNKENRHEIRRFKWNKVW